MDRKEVTKVLLDIGMQRSNRGYMYMVDAIMLLDSGMSLNKALNVIAKSANTTYGAVERAIRYCIEQAWKVTAENYKLVLFGDSFTRTGKVPKMREFILAVISYVETK